MSAFDKKAAEALFDEDIEEHRRFYAAGYTNRARSSDPLPESIRNLPEPLSKIVELGYQDAAEGLKPRVPVNLPKQYFEPDPPKGPPTPEPSKTASQGSGAGSGTKPKSDAPKPKAEEEFIPPTDQAKYWYRQGYAGVSVREPPEFTKWYRAGLRDRTASLPSRVAVPTDSGTSKPSPNTSLAIPIAAGLGLFLVAALLASGAARKGRRYVF